MKTTENGLRPKVLILEDDQDLVWTLRMYGTAREPINSSETTSIPRARSPFSNPRAVLAQVLAMTTLAFRRKIGGVASTFFKSR